MFILVERESSRNHCNGARKTFGRRTGSGGPSAPRERQCACPAVDDVFSANLTYPGVIQEQYERIRHTLTLIQQKKYRSAYSVEAGKVSNAELAQFDIKSQAVHHPTKSSGRQSPLCSRSIFTGRQLRSKGGRLFLMLNYRNDCDLHASTLELQLQSTNIPSYQQLQSHKPVPCPIPGASPAEARALPVDAPMRAARCISVAGAEEEEEEEEEEVYSSAETCLDGSRSGLRVRGAAPQCHHSSKRPSVNVREVMCSTSRRRSIAPKGSEG